MTSTREQEVSVSSSGSVEPFLRWAGGKRWLAPHIRRLVPGYRTYFEPFVGGGSVFLELGSDRSVLSDMNEQLVECYVIVRDHPTSLAEIVSGWANTKKKYYEIRSATFHDSINRAAQFIYLNRTCWNGLYRVNKAGEFNVPFGNNTDRRVLDHENLFEVSRRLHSADIHCADFEMTTSKATEGDFLYLDPPYAVPGKDQRFLRYNSTRFTWEDQQRLAVTAKTLAADGCLVAISNADVPEVHHLYPEFSVVRFTRPSSLAGDPRKRAKTTEVLFVSWGVSS